MQAPEIELKFPVADPTAFQSTLSGLGFRLDTPRTFESNTLYDTPGRDLREQRQLLRLRQYGALWTLTHKRHADQAEEDDASRYKVRIETEAHVDDGEAVSEIFSRLGYGPVFRYEKFRTEWSIPLEERLGEGTGHLVIDETAIGTYAELEGPREWIDQMLVRLKIDPSSCLTDSYGKLFLNWKERSGSDAENLTFAEIHEHVLTAQ